MNRHFVIHTVPNCPWCSLVRHEIRKRMFSFEMHPHNDEAERAEFKTRYGVTTFPQVFVAEDGEWKRIGGYEETKVYLEALP